MWSIHIGGYQELKKRCFCGIVYYTYLLVYLCMNLTCIECKNQVDLSPYSELAVDTVIECQICGITLLVTDVSGDTLAVEIMDEGK